jgi:flagellar basal body rod protein FlgC
MKYLGNKANHWKGGRCINTQGYVLIYRPSHPFANGRGYVREHRIVMEQYLGRYLEPNEAVHHIDGNKQNNNISNLSLMTRSEHDSYENRKKWTPEMREKVSPLHKEWWTPERRAIKSIEVREFWEKKRAL